MIPSLQLRSVDRYVKLVGFGAFREDLGSGWLSQGLGLEQKRGEDVGMAVEDDMFTMRAVLRFARSSLVLLSAGAMSPTTMPNAG